MLMGLFISKPWDTVLQGIYTLPGFPCQFTLLNMTKLMLPIQSTLGKLNILSNTTV
jgi:hypothetical protein